MVPGGESFFAEGKLPGRFNAAHFCKQWAEYINIGIGEAIALMSDDDTELHGALGGIFYPCPLTGDNLATEQFFYVVPQFRGEGMKLLYKFIARAAERNVARVQMIHLESLHPETLKKVYERMGFRKIETGYMKELHLHV